MIYLEYDARVGHAYSDGECEEIVNDWIEDHNEGKDIGALNNPIWFSTSNILYPVRVAIREGRIVSGQVHLEYKGQVLKIYPSGGISPWPNGFCDHFEHWLMKLL